ncbi:MAG: hypothetical protein ACREDR_06695 [Blastocatellia bacterium]
MLLNLLLKVFVKLRVRRSRSVRVRVYRVIERHEDRSVSRSLVVEDVGRHRFRQCFYFHDSYDEATGGQGTPDPVLSELYSICDASNVLRALQFDIPIELAFGDASNPGYGSLDEAVGLASEHRTELLAKTEGFAEPSASAFRGNLQARVSFEEEPAIESTKLLEGERRHLRRLAGRRKVSWRQAARTASGCECEVGSRRPK